MPDTIRAKIALLTGGLSLLIVFGFGLFLYTSLRWQLYQSADDNLRVRAEQLMRSIETENGQLRFGRGTIANLSLREEDTAHLISPTGDILDRLGEEYVPVIPPSEIPPDNLSTLRFIDVEDPDQEQDLEVFRVLVLPVAEDGQNAAYLQVGRDVEDIQDDLTRLLGLLLISAPILVAIASIGGYGLTGRALAPIEEIRKKAASIQAKAMHQRLPIATNDEVGRLACTFNEMLDRLEESFHRQRRFTADASHELRTPLSVIRGEVDVALDRPRTPAEYVETLESIGTETQRLSRLVNELLLLARADAGKLRLEVEPVDLADLLRLLAEQMQPQARVHGGHLRAEVPPTLVIAGDRDRLLELFINLVENALVHAPGSPVKIHARSSGDHAVVSVADAGPGIPREHLPHIFERFYRVDPVRERSRSDSGLGLAIAREIVQAHGGQIAVQSEPGKGTTVIVQLPARSP